MENNKISIILITKNGEKYLEEVLRAIFSQKLDDPYEVIAIDSGSVDKTKEILKGFSIRIEEIPSSSFNHGETRNLGARISEGPYIVFLTQDATPVNEEWLKNLIEPLKRNEKVAGAFSKQIPRRDCPLMEKRQILETELVSGDHERINSATNNPDYEKNPYPYIWFSNTSSCIRREVWEKIPFRKLDFAEDQDWAKRVLEAGFLTVYVPTSVVSHSHHYRPIRNFRRHYEHSKAMKDIFGKDEFPYFKHIFSATRNSVKGDYRFYRAEGGSTAGFIRWFIPSLIWYGSAFFGLWLGTKADKVPKRFRDRIALQRAIIRQ
ncbi:MAG: glycosyltransferase family 2 protein [Thermodesulfobacteriota bacterium]